MNDLSHRIIGFSIYAIPLIGIEYLLLKTLVSQIRIYNGALKGSGTLNVKFRILATAFGVFFGIFLIVNLLLFVFRQGAVPAIFLIISMIGFVPYVFFVYRMAHQTGSAGSAAERAVGKTSSEKLLEDVEDRS